VARAAKTQGSRDRAMAHAGSRDAQLDAAYYLEGNPIHRESGRCQEVFDMIAHESPREPDSADRMLRRLLWPSGLMALAIGLLWLFSSIGVQVPASTDLQLAPAEYANAVPTRRPDVAEWVSPPIAPAQLFEPIGVVHPSTYETH
jgi:hypothetical protein